MDADLLPRLIRIGRGRVMERGVRSAEKLVSPLSWFTDLSCDEVASNLCGYFRRELHATESNVSEEELADAQRLVAVKYGTPEWIHRLP